jgi:hypothetical protein
MFIGAIINFLIVAVAVFLMIVKLLGTIVKKTAGPPPAPGEPTVKECPLCLSEIPSRRGAADSARRICRTTARVRSAPERRHPRRARLRLQTRKRTCANPVFSKNSFAGFSGVFDRATHPPCAFAHANAHDRGMGWRVRASAL